jgi:pyruvate formate lyase activating enzyme
VAFTYNDPVIFAEYAMDTADACHALGIKTVAVTAGYMHPGPAAKEFYSKGWTPPTSTSRPSPTTSTSSSAARQLATRCSTSWPMIHGTRPHCWLEITTLLIPGKNDGGRRAQARTGSAWVRQRNSGPTCRLHFSGLPPGLEDERRFPRHAAGNAGSAPASIAMEAGLHYVYTGNVHDKCRRRPRYCPGCGKAGDRARLVRASSATRSTMHGPLPALRHGGCRALRQIRQGLRPAADSGAGCTPAPDIDRRHPELCLTSL